MSNEQSWTLGPWAVCPQSHTIEVGVRLSGLKLATCWIEGAWVGGDSDKESRANARRIVDCVNALEGFSDPAAYIAVLRGCVEALERVAGYKQREPNQLAIGIARTALANLREVAK